MKVQRISDIVVTINDTLISSVQSYDVVAKKKGYLYSPYAYESQQKYVLSTPMYSVSLKKLIFLLDHDYPNDVEMDLYSLSDFTVKIKTLNKEVVYTNCEWNYIGESVDGKKLCIDEMNLVAKGRTVNIDWDELEQVVIE